MIKIQKKENIGITLIALVITIVVLLILAGVSMAFLTGDNGIITRATEAKQKNQQQTMLEQLKLASIASLDNEGKISTETLKEELNKINGVNITDENLTLPISLEIDGVRYVVNENGDAYLEKWHYTDNKEIITNGIIKIKLGDKINYDATNGGKLTDIDYSYKSSVEKNGNSEQTFGVSGATGLEWRVLGVEDGKIIIMPTTNLLSTGNWNIGRLSIGQCTNLDAPTEDDVKNTQKAYLNVVDELDRICSIYGHGNGADRARSIKVEDVNRITGYIPEDEMFDNETKDDCTDDYGKEVTYMALDNGRISCEYYEGENLTKLDRNITFVCYTGKEWKQLEKTDGSLTVKNTFYEYQPTLSNLQNDNIYNLIFADTGTQDYWLSSKYLYSFGNGSQIRYGIWRIRDLKVSGYDIYTTAIEPDTNSHGVRPVVYLQEDIELEQEGGDTDSWLIK